MNQLKIISNGQNLLLREFCKTFPPVINDKRPTGDLELSVEKEILSNDKLLRKYLDEYWVKKGWDSLGTAAEMNEFLLFRTAPDMLFVMPFFRNIGYHPHRDKAGVLQNDEPMWWLGENNYWNKTLRLYNTCVETESFEDSFCVRFRYLDNKSLAQIKKIQVEKMEESFEEADPEVLVENISPRGVWSNLPTMETLVFNIPHYEYSYPRRDFYVKQKLGINLDEHRYSSIGVFTAFEPMRVFDFNSSKVMFIAPDVGMKVLNWTSLREKDLREFISVL